MVPSPDPVKSKLNPYSHPGERFCGGRSPRCLLAAHQTPCQAKHPFRSQTKMHGLSEHGSLVDARHSPDTATHALVDPLDGPADVRFSTLIALLISRHAAARGLGVLRATAPAQPGSGHFILCRLRRCRG